MFDDFHASIKVYQTWLKESILANFVPNFAFVRKWCNFNLEQLSFDKISELFSRKQFHDRFLSLKEEDSKTEPYTQLLYDMHNLASFHKAFAMRHKTRLQIYRDDLINREKINISLNKSIGRDRQRLYTNN